MSSELKAEEEMIGKLKESFPTDIIEAKVLRPKRIIVTVRKEKIIEIARFCREELGFDHPISMGVVDFIKDGVFQANYYVLSSSKKMLLILRTMIERDKPHMNSLTSVWEAMNYHEREAWEMFGIVFEGHPNLERLLLPEDWKEGYPLRKDFKLES